MCSIQENTYLLTLEGDLYDRTTILELEELPFAYLRSQDLWMWRTKSIGKLKINNSNCLYIKIFPEFLVRRENEVRGRARVQVNFDHDLDYPTIAFSPEVDTTRSDLTNVIKRDRYTSVFCRGMPVGSFYNFISYKLIKILKIISGMRSSTAVRQEAVRQSPA